ncbi:MAG: Ig-like domain-containing protein [Tannerella sp.]|nr:Ig-like domain-containing protein [Tannerella sp.]
MKTKLFLLSVLFLFACWSEAENVPVDRALRAAEQYYGQMGNVSLRSSGDSRMTLAYTAKPEGMTLRSSAGVEAYFYVFNLADSGGFIIVSGNDRAYPVLGYSFKGSFDVKNAPPVFMEWLQGYQNEISTVRQNHPEFPVDPAWAELEKGTLLRNISLRRAVGPLGTAEWNQGDPYNLQCPLLGSTRTVTGCTATAMAIVMKYHADHGFRSTGTGSHSYTWDGKTLSANFGSFDWANMPDTTAGYTNDTQKNAVAKLMYHCGVSIEANYGTGSGGGTSAALYDVETALVNHFGYDASMEHLWRSGFSDDEWKSLLKTELDNNRPVPYAGWGGKGAHAFVCEGYTDYDEYSMNWGWGGYANGNFRLSALNAGGYSFNSEQAMIIGLKKAESNSGDLSPLRLITSYMNNVLNGMSKDVENVRQNQGFTVNTGLIHNNSYTKFKGHIGVALFDGAGGLKAVLSSTGTEVNPGYGTTRAFYCTISQPIDSRDILRIVSSVDGGKTWRVVKGTKGVTDFLPVISQVAVTGVSLSASNRSLTVGDAFRLTATINPSNATNQTVIWTSSNSTVAEVDASGLVTAKAVGRTTITVTTADGNKTATCTVDVTAANVPVTGVSLNASSRSLTVGGTFQLTATIAPASATNKAVSWSSSNGNVASVSTSGLVTAKAAGMATITVTTVDGNKTATCAISVTPATVSVTGVSLNASSRSLTVGDVFQLTATIAPASATNKAVSWSSSNGNVASVSTSGLVTAKAIGRATITVTTADGNKTATCIVDVTAATVAVTGVSLDVSTRSLTTGQTFQLTATVSPANATNQAVTWSSSNSTVAEVDASGLVTAGSAGTATITVKTVDGNRMATCTVTVTNATVAVTGVSLDVSTRSLTTGQTFRLTATVSPADATNQAVTWSSSNSTVAGVDASGLVTAGSAGTATIMVKTVDGNRTATCTVTVTNATVAVTGISLNITEQNLPVGQTVQLTATVTPSNAANKNVTWSSSNTAAASVTPSGLVKANATGTATITVTTIDGGLTATCEVTASSSCQSPIKGGYTGSLTWILCASGTLTLTGAGDIPNYYTALSHPWYQYRYYFSIVEMNEGITRIGDRAFADCQSIATIAIPRSVKSIGTNAFFYCLGITGLEIPGSVTSIASHAFNSCLNLASVTVSWATPLNVPADIFYGVTLKKVVLHVPAGTKARYEATPVWKDFGTVIEDVTLTSMEGNSMNIAVPEETANSDIQAYVSNNRLYVNSPSTEQIGVYSLGGSMLYSVRKDAGATAFDVRHLPKGVYIVKGSSGWTRKVAKFFY